MAWPPGYVPPPVGAPNYGVPYTTPAPVYQPPVAGGWPPGTYGVPQTMPPPSAYPSGGSVWPPSYTTAAPPTSTYPSTGGGWAPTTNPYGSGPTSTPGYLPTSSGSTYSPYSSNTSYSSTGSGAYSSSGGGYSGTGSTLSTGNAWPPSGPNGAPAWNTNPAPTTNTSSYTSGSAYGPGASPGLSRSYSKPVNVAPVGNPYSLPGTSNPPSTGAWPPPTTGMGVVPSSVSTPYVPSQIPAGAPSYAQSSSYSSSYSAYSSSFSSGGNPYGNAYSAPAAGNPYSLRSAPSSNQLPQVTNAGPYGAPPASQTSGTATYSPQTGRADTASAGVSPMQQMLLKEQQEEEARVAARKAAENEAAAKRAAIEALQKRESAEAQKQSFMHQMELDRIQKEAQEAQAELEREQKAALTAEAKKQEQLLLQIQQERAEIEAKNRAAQRLRAQQDEAKLKAEQERLDARQAALAAKEKALATAAERAKQEEMEARKAREAEMAKQSEETEKLQQSFYSSILEITKILATTNQRIVKLISLSYPEILGGQNETTPNTEKQFMDDLLGHLQKTSDRLLGMIKDNVLNVDDSIHSSISANVSSLSSAIGSLIQYCRRLIITNQPLDQEMQSMSDDDRQSHAKKRATAVTYAIRSILDSLEKMKIEETASADGAKVLSAGSKEETTQNVEAQLQAQTAERGRIAAQFGITSKKPVLLSSNFDPSSLNMGSYNVDKVRILQRVIHHWATRLHFQQLVENLTQANASTAMAAHRKKVLFEVLSTEASYFQTLDIIVEYFFKPMTGAANKPNNGIITLSEVKILFGSIEAIHAFSKKLFAEFDARLQKWPVVQLFGDIFVDYADEMLVYSDYINGFDEATIVLKKLLANPKFVAFEQECMKATGKRLDLASYLIQPVQRMPRYGLLLKELISHSSPEHIDYKNLEEAKTKVGEVCSTINKKKQEYDNKTAVMRVTSEINGMPTPLDPTKSLFISSEFVQLEGPHKHWTRAFLFSNVVVFAKCKSDKPGIPGPYTYWESYNLVDVGVVGRKGHKKSFLMWDKTGTKKMERILHFSEEIQNARWLKDMKETIESASLKAMLNDDENSNNGTNGNSSSSAQAATNKILGNAGMLTLLCASYGDLTNPNATIDVTTILQRIIQDQGGKMLTLPATPKSSLPGFIDPAKSRKKSLLIVYTYGGIPKSRTFMDETAVQITN